LNVAETVAVLANVSVTVKVAVTVPVLPSVTVASPMTIFGLGGRASAGAAKPAASSRDAKRMRARRDHSLMGTSGPRGRSRLLIDRPNRARRRVPPAFQETVNICVAGPPRRVNNRIAHTH
jgi:hypothetical protein